MTNEAALHIQPKVENLNFEEGTITITVPNEWLEITADALEKQIPKKPTRKGYRDDCPVCSVVFRENDFGIHYCWNCGTKLNWSDSND